MSVDAKTKLPTHAFKQFIRVFPPSSDLSPDGWAATVSSNIKVGDVFILFKGIKEELLEKDQLELELDGVALIYREDAGFPMNYLLDEKLFEMSFMEGVLSSKAAESKDEGLALCCLHSNLKKEMTKDLAAILATMAKTYGGSGERTSDTRLDPL